MNSISLSRTLLKISNFYHELKCGGVGTVHYLSDDPTGCTVILESKESLWPGACSVYSVEE